MEQNEIKNLKNENVKYLKQGKSLEEMCKKQ